MGGGRGLPLALAHPSLKRTGGLRRGSRFGGQAGSFFGERKQGFTFSRTEAATIVFAQKKDNEGEDETKADR